MRAGESSRSLVVGVLASVAVGVCFAFGLAFAAGWRALLAVAALGRLGRHALPFFAMWSYQ